MLAGVLERRRAMLRRIALRMAEPKGREKSKMIEPNQTQIAAKST
jgi:hypothetical protein